MQRHPYLDRTAGWDIIAGQDVTVRHRTTRYMLVFNPSNPDKTKKAAILTASRPKASLWQTLHEGSIKEMTQLFDKIGGEGFDN